MNNRTPRAARPLAVAPALVRFRARLRAAMLRGSADLERAARRVAALGRVEAAILSPEVDTVGCFEGVLNGCLDDGYRAEPLAAFVFEALHRRFTARVRRRLAASGQDPASEEVADLVATTAEAVHGLIRGASRERHSLTYALLVSIADHRTIDYLRRKRPEYRDTMDDRSGECDAWSLGTRREDPEQRLVHQQRISLARRLREVVLDAVNCLPDQERAALVLVEIEGLGYDEVAAALGIKRTDVGNVVRRARLKRDRGLMPLLRAIPDLDGHVGFAELQNDRALRLNMLRWTTEMGDGVCARCLGEHHHLHTAEMPCLRPSPAVDAPLAAALH